MPMSSNDRKTDFPQFPDCFVCGSNNPRGLRTSFLRDGDGVKAVFMPDAMHCGFSGVVHGGVIASLLDEALVWACWIRTGRFGVTGNISIRYLQPLPVGTSCLVRARLVQDRKKLWDVESWLEGDSGVVFARAEGIMVPLKNPVGPPDSSNGRENSCPPDSSSGQETSPPSQKSLRKRN